MLFNKHYRLEGQHAYLSASKPSWVNYDEDKLFRVFGLSNAAKRGTELHELAHNLIRLNVKLPRTQKTLNMYVNDAIGYGLNPEQILYFTDNIFGTADAVGYSKGKLRIHDLKTGITPAKITQLEIYAAIFCLEYDVKPAEIEIELRIYQNDEVQIFEADPDVITHIMDKAKVFDKLLNEWKKADQ